MYQTNLALPEDSPLQEFLATLPLKYRTIVALAYFTSSKIIDILSLKISDIDADKILIVQSDSGFSKLVPINPLLRPYLTIYLDGMGQKSTEFVFANSVGESMDSMSVFEVLKLVARQINFPEVYLFVLS
ncbi:hypothetical protein PCC8801_0343 [Rippkaea orientalis PCC 8801]|uniref:Tyr recombinase domain-containing protein n=1 Tax=Rippkaea orientalis (strain PCC 8801 / RF-1) TaxID=41431 RepID=B7K3C1_RIPO1|nr:tyrosine-type recombinase/integrase [Rippkaea orientalis]ACK64441.1 hypothetical protein PCC8801_0343 [Rippkaea orientalis PCC 8801]